MAYQDSGMLELANPQLASILRQRRFAEQLMQSGADASPIQHPLQGLSRLAQALMGGYEARSADSKMDEIGQKQEKRRQEYMGGMSEPTQPPLSGMPAMVAGQEIPPPAPVSGQAPAMTPELMQHFQTASARTRIPVDVLVAQAQQESGLNPNAVGRAGEIGLMQVSPKTARDPGFGLSPVDPATLRDAGVNIQFGADYLAARAKERGVTDWNNPVHRAAGLTAYNGGGDPNYAQNVERRMPGSSSVLPPTMIGATPTVTPGVDIEALQGRAAQARAKGNAGLGDPDSVIRSRAQGYLHEADRLDRLAEQERVRVDNRAARLQDRADASAERDQNRADARANKVPSHVIAEDEHGKAALFVLKPDGTLGNRIGSVPEKEGKLPTEEQSKAALYGHRMVEAESIISKLEHIGTSSVEAARSKVPGIGNLTASADYQSFEQAKRNFITAVLRRESGASIQPNEYEMADKLYFPKVWDGPAVLKQKEDARRTAVVEMRASSGPASSRVPEVGPAREREPAPNSAPASAPRVIQYDATGKRVAQ